MRHGRTQNRIVRFFKAIYLKLVRIDDTPQKIAAGVGLGVFFGMMPGMGPIAALFFAFLLKVNRAAALLGSILTNTWLSIPVFLLAVKAGAMASGLQYKAVHDEWTIFLKDFHWARLFQLSVYRIILPIIVGYAIISLAAAALAYAVVLIAVKNMSRNRSRKSREE